MMSKNFWLHDVNFTCNLFVSCCKYHILQTWSFLAVGVLVVPHKPPPPCKLSFCFKERKQILNIEEFSFSNGLPVLIFNQLSFVQISSLT